MARFDAVVFDMDGVLIDSEPIHFAVLNSVLALDGLPLASAEYEEFIGTTSAAMFASLIERHGLPRSVLEYISLYDQALLLELEQPRPPEPGVAELIAYLRVHGVRLGVASSSRRSWIRATLAALGLLNAFDSVVSGEEVARGKPDPAIYLLAAEQLGVPPERCMAIEDSPHGVQSARAAGMTVLGVRTPSTAHLRLDGALRTVDSLADLDLSGDVVRALLG
jgi:HAD superfamily hydrolase (TIGR01509 family)